MLRPESTLKFCQHFLSLFSSKWEKNTSLGSKWHDPGNSVKTFQPFYLQLFQNCENLEGENQNLMNTQWNFRELYKLTISLNLNKRTVWSWQKKKVQITGDPTFQ